MSEKPVYIHYGHNELGLPDPIRNRDFFSKPKGGLWASRLGDSDGWKRWCEREEFHVDSLNRFFEFTLKDSAKILALSDRDQLIPLPKLNVHTYYADDNYSTCYLDFEKLQEEYDAIELVDIGKFYFALYGWDCNSILIMNPEIVEVI